MGNISVNRLGGLSLIVGPVLALIFFLVQPGGLLVDSVDPANAQAAIVAIMGNSGLAHTSAFLIPLGLITLLFGILVLQGSIRGNGNGDALSRMGALFVLLAVGVSVVNSANTHVIASNAGAAAGALYALSLGMSTVGGSVLALGFVLFSLGLSTRDDNNKILALIAGLAALVSLIASLIGGADSSQLQTMGAISGICYIVLTAWSITLGLDLMKKE